MNVGKIGDYIGHGFGKITDRINDVQLLLLVIAQKHLGLLPEQQRIDLSVDVVIQALQVDGNLCEFRVGRPFVDPLHRAGHDPITQQRRQGQQ